MVSQKLTIFLDRDGVINVDSPLYIKTPREFRFISGSAEAVALLSQKGFHIIVITNQSMINRGISNRENLDAIFATMKAGIREKGGEIRDIFYCPHAPEEGCSCRKPGPGLIDLACKKYAIDPQASFMVGDSAKDMECAHNAGVGKAVLVLTGNGRKALKSLEAKQIKPDFIALDLMDAARWILQQQQGSLKEP
ncbi:GmhB [Desulforapulum autotrophicum HRM2]|uniref:D,D-heptose 1,7-bisphosphate phosphatase n=1 Tax=Desulforapulum autotrophicum (strain ATCC 43914 / DSM 3382 / VKM B-1955 / HRM2) TaxID=177437 RepID=C0QIP2_DESAH|nr:D-glycero-beta-D-manno-heptose 1,7-bisphosphate 7-phosphatase [Desulforapulum autotrophicum]ACN17986.1 GmhB [Desulforapulum autotrophicum HRM2]